MESMTFLWQRIEGWLASNTPKILGQLNPGASEEELARVEATLGFTLPEDFKASYHIHNGGSCLFVGMSESFISLERVVGEWSMYQEIKENESGWAERPPGFMTDPGRKRPPLQPVWWHPKLIPFAADGAGNNWCVDLDPASGGHVGQVIDWDHEDGPTEVLFPNFDALLSQLADDLEAGKYLGFENHLEWRLTEGKDGRDQAKRYDFEQPSPARDLLDNALSSGGSLALYTQILQMEQSSRVDRFRAYRYLILLQHRLGQRAEAERLLTAFEAEAQQMPAEHWVHDDLKEVFREVFAARNLLDYARQATGADAEKYAAFILAFTLHQNTAGFTAEERFEMYACSIDLYLRQQQPEQARKVFAQFAAEARKRPPEDPVHDTVRHWAVQLQHANSEQERSGN